MDVDDDDARTTSWRLRQIRNARGKSQRVVAGLAGISKSHLSRLGFGPSNTGFCRTSVALDLKDYDQAVAAAEDVNPQVHSNRSRQARVLGVLRPGADSAAETAR